MDYSAIEAKVEADMVRTELEPTPGGWWLDEYGEPFDGRCCLFSPQLIGVGAVRFADEVIAKQLGADSAWVHGAILGFDDSEVLKDFDGPIGNAGWAFGQRMREQHVREAQDA